MTGAPMTDPHAEIRTPRDIGEPSDTAVDAAAEAMWRAEVAAFPAASYARSSAKWEEQADGVRAKWTDLARAALSVTRTPTPDPSGAEEMRRLAELLADAAERVGSIPTPSAAATPTKIADPLLPEQIAELRALDEKATPGPWQSVRSPEDYLVSVQREGHGMVAAFFEGENEGADADLIAALRNFLPQLLSAAERGIAAGEEVERLKAELAEWQAKVRQLEELVRTADTAITASYLQADAEWRSHDRVAGRYDDDVRAWRDKARALLTPTHPETER